MNVIVWPGVLEAFRKEILSATLAGVYGQWQCEDGVRHLVAQRMVDLSPLLGRLENRQSQLLLTAGPHRTTIMWCVFAGGFRLFSRVTALECRGKTRSLRDAKRTIISIKRCYN
ncbi:hypothetical protein KB879_31770 (plasmid) [Cupriavidus sp. KK10]|nr:hypothetical protein [Cupriavidus sp. KK10]QUN32300.1 hypothetical protein KB879_31770 [Cupriavidus sp. KK10]